MVAYVRIKYIERERRRRRESDPQNRRLQKKRHRWQRRACRVIYKGVNSKYRAIAGMTAVVFVKSVVINRTIFKFFFF